MKQPLISHKDTQGISNFIIQAVRELNLVFAQMNGLGPRTAAEQANLSVKEQKVWTRRNRLWQTTQTACSAMVPYTVYMDISVVNILD